MHSVSFAGHAGSVAPQPATRSLRRLHVRARCVLAGATLGMLVLGLATGCGGRMELPTERREIRQIAAQGTYQMITTRLEMDGISDILLTPSGELFLVFKASARGAARVQEFPPGLNAPLSTSLPNLQTPAAIAFAVNRLFVLDQGDTAAARETRTSWYDAECGPLTGFRRPITRIERYWYVRAYRLTGDTLSAFTDTTFLWVNGVAADAAGRVYVSGVAAICRVDPFNQFNRTFDSEYRIRRYVPGPNDGSVMGGDWRRDRTYEVIEGTGIGSTRNPQGMQWTSATGPALYFADFGNNEVQKFADPTSGGSSFKLDFGGSGADSIHLSTPIDVAVDAAGFSYVADLGNKRVLRYSPEGAFVQRVDIEPDRLGRLLDLPIAVAADSDQVYVADVARAEVVRYRRRK